MAVQGARLTRAQEGSLTAICSIGPDGLERIADSLDASGLLISQSRIEELIVKEAGQENGTELTRFLFGIAIGFREGSTPAEATLGRITNLLKQLDEPDDRFLGWEKCRPLLLRLLASRSIRAAAKALQVSYDFERLYQAGRFLTSVRPVFDDARKQILGATIVQTLRLEFVSSSGDESSLSVALDRADIEQLRRSCDEAIRKADITLDTASTTWRLPTIMPGQEE